MVWEMGFLQLSFPSNFHTEVCELRKKWRKCLHKFLNWRSSTLEILLDSLHHNWEVCSARKNFPLFLWGERKEKQFDKRRLLEATNNLDEILIIFTCVDSFKFLHYETLSNSQRPWRWNLWICFFGKKSWNWRDCCRQKVRKASMCLFKIPCELCRALLLFSLKT